MILKTTLVGMNYYDSEMLEYSAKTIARPLVCLIRDTKFKYGIAVYIWDSSEWFRAGTIATSENLVLDETINGKVIAEEMSLDFGYLFRWENPHNLDNTEYGAQCKMELSGISTYDMLNMDISGNMRIEFELVLNSKFDAFLSPFNLLNKLKIPAKETTKQNGTTNATITLKDGDKITGGWALTIDHVSGNVINSNISNSTTKEKEKKMKGFNNFFDKKDFNFPTTNFALSMTGGLAVKVDNSFVVFDQETKSLTDVMDFVMEGFDKMIMIMPATMAQLEEGDLFVQNGLVYQLVDKEGLEVFNYRTSSIERMVEKKSLMGISLYAKVMNLMGNLNMNFGAAGDAGNMFANPMFLMMMMKDGDNDMSDFMQMMMMSQLFNSNTKK